MFNKVTFWNSRLWTSTKEEVEPMNQQHQELSCRISAVLLIEQYTYFVSISRKGSKVDWNSAISLCLWSRRNP